MLLTESHKQWLTDRFGPHVRFQEPMARHTYLRIGGPADAYVAPREQNDLAALHRWVQQNKLPCFTIGNGTNLLVLDSGIRGVVASLKHCQKEIRHTVNEQGVVIVTTGAATRLGTLCNYAIRNGFKGMNFALGIPGTVGGAVIMNAGTDRGSMADVIAALVILSPDGKDLKCSKKDLSFRYRGMDWSPRLHKPGKPSPIILTGEIHLSRGDRNELQADADRVMKTRGTTQPLHHWSAGSFFKNPPVGKTAGELIDLAGLKGKQVGDAQVSNRHANFIINRGAATAADILKLMRLIQSTVSASFNIMLEPEVQIVGT